MDLSERANKAWRAFVAAANPGGPHPFDSERLNRFLAFAYVDGDKVDYDACTNDMARFAEGVRDEVLSLISQAPDLFRALDDARA